MKMGLSVVMSPSSPVNTMILPNSGESNLDSYVAAVVRPSNRTASCHGVAMDIEKISRQ